MATEFREMQVLKMVQVKICDKCGKQVDHIERCYGCGKDLCFGCQNEMNYWDDPLDIDSVYEYCDECWKNGETQRWNITQLTIEIELLKNKWDEGCKR